MIVEVGKKYKGLINGVIFKILRYDPKNEHFEILTDKGKKLFCARSFLEHLIIEEVHEYIGKYKENINDLFEVVE